MFYQSELKVIQKTENTWYIPVLGAIICVQIN
jgi:hypothetical protein